MKSKILTACIASILSINSLILPNVSASEETPIAYSAISSESEITPLATGLITFTTLYCEKGDGRVYLNATTECSDKMKSVGIIDIAVEKSSDNKNWSTEKLMADMLNSDSYTYVLRDYGITVKGGAYYRITCTHYADEGGLFGKTQTMTSSSNSVWIS